MANPLIIGLSGKKQSGKNTICEGLKNWYFSYHFAFIKIYSFADVLKRQVCINVLGLSEEQCYGTDQEKNSLTKFKWENFPDNIRYLEEERIEEVRVIGETNDYENLFVLRKGFMTAREVMQVVGTDIFRNYFDQEIWVDATLRNIFQDKKNIALISDIRFPSEIDAIMKNGGSIIRLTRNVCEQDNHPSEIALDNYNFTSLERSYIIDNKDIGIEEQNKIAIDYFKKIIENQNG